MAADGLWVRVFDYFTNSKKSVSKRLGNFLFACLMLLVLDLFFNISHGFHQGRILDKLEQLSDLKKTYSKESDMLLYLNSLEDDIIKKKHPYDLFEESWSSLSFSTNNENTNTTTQNITHTNKLSIVFIALSSSTLLIFLIIASITAPIWSANYSFKNIRESISVAVVLSVSVVLLTYLCSLIPVLYNPYPWINFIIYFAIQLFLIVVGFKISDKISDRESKTFS